MRTLPSKDVANRLPLSSNARPVGRYMAAKRLMEKPGGKTAPSTSITTSLPVGTGVDADGSSVGCGVSVAGTGVSGLGVWVAADCCVGVGGTAVSVGAGTAMSALVGVGSVVLVVGIGVGETAVASLCAISVSMGAAVGDACTVHDVRMNRVMSKLH